VAAQTSVRRTRVPVSVTAALLGVAAIAATAPPAGAAPRQLDAPATVLPGQGPPVLPFGDRVLPAAPSASASAVPGARAAVRTYRTGDDASILVELSDAYADGPTTRARIQRDFIDLLGSRLHGAELSRLKMFIAPPSEVRRRCGGGSRILACYSPRTERMIVPGETPRGFSDAIVGYAITHEYGHHIAANRDNFPFSAVQWGAKRWSSYVKVCDGVQDGRFVPGDQGSRYLDNPGEGFADSYAHLTYPNATFQYNPALAPTPGSLAALRRDVVSPWRRPVVRVVRGTAGPGRTFATSIPLGLDGELRAELFGPANADLDVRMTNSRGQVRRTTAAGSRDRLSVPVCRRGAAATQTESRSLRIIRVSGSGPFTLRISWPG
jgi:hypothetical protein